MDVELHYPRDSVSAVTQNRHKQYYEGSEIMVAGRIADHKLSSFKADVQARGVSGGLRRVARLGSTQRLLTGPHCSPPLPGACLNPEWCPLPCSMPHTPQAQTSLQAGIPGTGWNGAVWP